MISVTRFELPQRKLKHDACAVQIKFTFSITAFEPALRDTDRADVWFREHVPDKRMGSARRQSFTHLFRGRGGRAIDIICYSLGAIIID